MPRNLPLDDTIRDLERLIEWYRIRLLADRHLDARTVLCYREEITRLTILRNHLEKRRKK